MPVVWRFSPADWLDSFNDDALRLFPDPALPLTRKSPASSGTDRWVRLQIFAAFLGPVALVGLWLWSKGFFGPT